MNEFKPIELTDYEIDTLNNAIDVLKHIYDQTKGKYEICDDGGVWNKFPDQIQTNIWSLNYYIEHAKLIHIKD